MMTPWLWEMSLLLPAPLFYLVKSLFLGNIDCRKSSHYKWDLDNGRKTTISSHLGEIVKVCFVKFYFIFLFVYFKILFLC